MDLCQAKVDDFALLGYDQISLDDFWAYVSAKVRKDVQLHQIVEFILSARVTDYMNYQTISAYRSDELPDP